MILHCSLLAMAYRYYMTKVELTYDGYDTIER